MRTELSLERHMCWLDDVGCWHGFLLLVRRLGIVAVVAGACAGQLEGLDGEGEVLVTGVIDQEPVERAEVTVRSLTP